MSTRIAAWWDEVEDLAGRLMEPLMAFLATSPEYSENRLEEWGPPGARQDR